MSSPSGMDFWGPATELHYSQPSLVKMDLCEPAREVYYSQVSLQSNLIIMYVLGPASEVQVSLYWTSGDRMEKSITVKFCYRGLLGTGL